jgi:hypothetical protein
MNSFSKNDLDNVQILGNNCTIVPRENWKNIPVNTLIWYLSSKDDFYRSAEFNKIFDFQIDNADGTFSVVPYININNNYFEYLDLIMEIRIPDQIYNNTTNTMVATSNAIDIAIQVSEPTKDLQKTRFELRYEIIDINNKFVQLERIFNITTIIFILSHIFTLIYTILLYASIKQS